MVRVTLTQAALVCVWGVLLTFIYSVGHDVFDSAPIDACDLCSVVNGTTKTRFIDSFESDSLLAFKNKQPVCSKHYYILPKEHIKNVHSDEVNCTLVSEMLEVCNKILDEEGITQGRKAYFDNPPFTTYSHLYLNCLVCSGFDSSLMNPQFYLNWFSESFAPDLKEWCRV